MRKICVIWIMSLAVGILSIPSIAGDWYVVREQMWDYADGEGSGTGSWDWGAGTDEGSWAGCYAQIEYGVSSNTLADGGAQYEWRVYVVDYDPQIDPPLTAHVSGEAYILTLGRYDLEHSTYDIYAGAGVYVNGPYWVIDITLWTDEPDDGDVISDYFTDEIDVSYNGATVYLIDSAAALSCAYSTADKVRVEAYAQAISACEVEPEQ